MFMLLVSFFKWWYGDGWRQRARMVIDRIDSTTDYFSLDLLVKTLFAPFRQISAGSVDGSLEVKLRALGDRLISRLIGAIVRSMLIVIGLLTIAIQTLLGGIVLLVWVIVPAFPLIGLVMMFIGWTF